MEVDKKTYVFGSTFKYVVKKLGYADSTEKEHIVVDETPNKIEVQLVRKAKVSQKIFDQKHQKKVLCCSFHCSSHSSQKMPSYL